MKIYCYIKYVDGIFKPEISVIGYKRVFLAERSIWIFSLLWILISFENLEEYHVKVSLEVFSRIKYVHGGRWKIEKVLDKVS